MSEVAVKERPILFSALMVRAIIAGTKTQTRRVVKPQPAPGCHYVMNGGENAALHLAISGGSKPCVPPTPRSKDHRLPCPFGVPGDRLWVKETWSPDHAAFYPNFPVVYRAENSILDSAEQKAWFPFRWRSPRFMPRRASRITLEITSVKVERLQAISEEDAKAEGVETHAQHYGDKEQLVQGMTPWHRYDGEACCAMSAKGSFKSLWESINGKASWDSSPWVWVVSFKKVEESRNV